MGLRGRQIGQFVSATVAGNANSSGLLVENLFVPREPNQNACTTTTEHKETCDAWTHIVADDILRQLAPWLVA